MDLEDTMHAMTSDDFKQRFWAEYWQTKIRYNRLHEMIVKFEAGKLTFKPKCSLDVFKKQASCMGQYLYMLEVRAQIEGIDLNEVF